jgi:hypothetical protein
MTRMLYQHVLREIDMSESIAKQESERDMETLRGIDVPRAVAKRLKKDHEQRDVELDDLLNDYIMLCPSMTLRAADRN